MNIPRSRTQVRLLAALAATTMLLATVLLAQESRDSAPPPIPDLARRQAEQTATILGLDSLIAKVHQVEASHSKDPVDAMTALMLRQELSESIQRASLDVDGVLAELTSERNRLGDLRAALQNRRGRTVARFNAIALITGSGVSAAVSATQFTSLGSRTQNAGDAIGIGSGVAYHALFDSGGPQAAWPEREHRRNAKYAGAAAWRNAGSQHLLSAGRDAFSGGDTSRRSGTRNSSGAIESRMVRSTPIGHVRSRRTTEDSGGRHQR